MWVKAHDNLMVEVDDYDNSLIKSTWHEDGSITVMRIMVVGDVSCEGLLIEVFMDKETLGVEYKSSYLPYVTFKHPKGMYEIFNQLEDVMIQVFDDESK